MNHSTLTSLMSSLPHLPSSGYINLLSLEPVKPVAILDSQDVLSVGKTHLFSFSQPCIVINISKTVSFQVQWAYLSTLYNPTTLLSKEISIFFNHEIWKLTQPERGPGAHAWGGISRIVSVGLPGDLTLYHIQVPAFTVSLFMWLFFLVLIQSTLLTEALLVTHSLITVSVGGQNTAQSQAARLLLA